MQISTELKAPIIIVWVGKLPKWFAQPMFFIRANNPDRRVYFLTDSSYVPLSSDIATIITLNKAYVAKIRDKLPSLQYGGNFWKYCSIRLFILEEFVRNRDIREFFHAELDNAIFDLDGLSDKLNSYGKGLFVPRDAINRAIASLIYCNRVASLSELVNLYDSPNPPQHDMDALGMYSIRYETFFHSLPTESFYENSSRWHILSPQNLDGIFDAAAIGQYLLGIDPIHCRFKPCKNGFINENCKIDFTSVEFVAEESKIFIYFKDRNASFQLYNIHLHSKNFAAFSKILQNDNVLKGINNGKKSIIANHLMLLIGPIILIIRKIGIASKRLISIIIKGLF